MNTRGIIAGIAFMIIMCFSNALASSGITVSITDATITPMSDGKAVIIKHHYGEHYLDAYLVQGTEIEKSAQFEWAPEDFITIPTASAFPEFLVSEPEKGTLGLYAWKDDGLATLREWPNDASWLVKPEGILLTHGHRNQGSLQEEYEFVDHSGETLLMMQAPLSDWGVRDIAWDAEGWLLLCVGNGGIGKGIRRVMRSGETAWEYEMRESALCDGVFSDGQGGAWISYSKEYAGDTILLHINADGNADHRYSLSGERRVKYLYCSKTYEDGTVKLFGTSVAASKGVYDVFALSFDKDGDITQIDVRAFNERKDYAISLVMDASEEVYVCSQLLEGYPPMLVPFSELSPRNEHGLVLQ